MNRGLRNIWITLFFCMAVNPILYGQADTTQSKAFHAKIIGQKDSLPVMFAHVFNESKRISAITDISGEFSIYAEKGDTLVVDAMGYYPKVIYTANISETFPIIYQQEKYYEIAEVQVTALGTYRQFKQKVLNLDIPQTETENLRNSLSDASFEAAKDIERRPSVAEQHNPIPSGIKVASILTPYEKQLRSFSKYQKKEARRKVIYAKYNKDLIRKITHLDEPELTDFYAWLDLKEEWLYEASQYEIGKVIKEKFNVYLAEKGIDPDGADSPE